MLPIVIRFDPLQRFTVLGGESIKRWMQAGSSTVTIKGILVMSNPGNFYLVVHTSETLATALAHHQAGRLQEAEALYGELLAEEPTHADALHLKGVLAHQRGNSQQAIDLITLALAVQPVNPTFYLNLGNAYLEVCRYPEAIESYQSALTYRPDDWDALYNLGIAYQKSGRAQDCIAAYQQAIALRPNVAGPYRNLGAVYHENREVDQAITFFQKAMDLEEDVAVLAELCHNMGDALYDQGKLEEALPYFEQASLLKPTDALWGFHQKTLCPIIPQSETEIRQYRTTLQRELQQALADPFPVSLETLPASGCEPSFFLSYQGEADREIKSQFGNLFTGILERQYPQLMRPVLAQDSGPVRVAFLVTEHHEWIFLKFMQGLLQKLPAPDLQLTVICPPQSIPTLSKAIAREDVAFYPIPATMEQAILGIKAQQFHRLVLFEAGTDSLNYFLPFFRLAQVQCATWGLPNTTGIPAMDYFISSSLLEPDAAQQQYRETLVTLPHLPTYFYRPDLPLITKTRQDFGLPQGKHLYFCPQSLFKMHPDMDALFSGILEADPAGEVVLIGGKYPHWQALLTERFQRTIPQVVNRIRFLPRLSTVDYVNALAQMDVMLDTLHYGGGYTNYEAFCMGMPIVTLPGTHMRGRMTMAKYHMMEIGDGIVDSREGYIEKAVQIGTDAAYRQVLQQSILERNAVLYEEMASVTAWTDFLLNPPPKREGGV